MGKKCFVPRCNSGYKSCLQKYSLFSAPQNEALLKLWMHAIPRKDRSLQASDFVCEKHFEPRFVSKSWIAEYNGNVLVSTPRRASLAENTVPSIFPDLSSVPLQASQTSEEASGQAAYRCSQEKARSSQ